MSVAKQQGSRQEYKPTGTSCSGTRRRLLLVTTGLFLSLSKLESGHAFSTSPPCVPIRDNARCNNHWSHTSTSSGGKRQPVAVRSTLLEDEMSTKSKSNSDSSSPTRSVFFDGSFLPSQQQTPAKRQEEHQQQASKKFSLSPETLGYLVLFTVPISWGTYVPCVQMLYQVDPPIPGLAFSASYFTVAAISMLGICAIPGIHSLGRGDSDTTLGTTSSQKVVSSTSPSTSATSATAAQQEEQTGLLPTVFAGIELGGLVFAANCLQVLGLKTVPADRAGFLIQMTTILVPLVSALLAGNLFAVEGSTWIGCLLALAGIVVMSVGNPLDILTAATATEAAASASAATSSSFDILDYLSQGDLLVLGSSLLYSFNIIRISRWANLTTPLKLATSKSVVEAILSIALIGGLLQLGGDVDVGNVVSSSSIPIPSLVSSDSSALMADIADVDPALLDAATTTATSTVDTLVESSISPAIDGLLEGSASEAVGELLESSTAAIDDLLESSLVDMSSSSIANANGILTFCQDTGRELNDFVYTFQDKLATNSISNDAMIKIAGTTLWAGLMGNAYIIFAQSWGQRRVKPSDANLIYSMQPLFTILFGYALLGQTVDANSAVGGGLILGGVLYVASRSMGK